MQLNSVTILGWAVITEYGQMGMEIAAVALSWGDWFSYRRVQ